MMRILLLCFFLLFTTVGLTAQDTLWVKQRDGKPYLLHKVKSGETLFLLSKKYAVPPAILADANGINYQDGLPPGSKFRIPIDNYNFIRTENVVKSKPIYYKANDEDDLRSISRMFNVSRSTIQVWNDLELPDVNSNDILQVGWIAYDKLQVPFIQTTPEVNTPVKAAPLPIKAPAQVKPKDSPLIKSVDETDTFEEPTQFEILYTQQTTGASITEEAGAAVFYPLKTKPGPGVYYAFHNTAIKGSILKIMNPASGKIIYAKVIGTLPNLKEYHNAVVGLSNNAVTAIGARDQRMFCKIKYR